jgi:ABC-2 type transport system ATP-binding protein
MIPSHSGGGGSLSVSSEHTEPVLAVKRIIASYDGVKALHGIDLEIAASEFVALLGLNGAGKTTLFHLLSGLRVPDAGAITINGSDMRRDPISGLRRMGVVFQEPTLDLDLSVEANLRFHTGLHGMSRTMAAQRITEELDRVGLSESARTIARRLSGGNRRRVEVARALLHEPNLLLLDEPTQGLDPAMRHELLTYAVDLCRRRSVSILWATHLVEETEQAHRVVVLNRGRVIAAASPSRLIERCAETTLERSFLRLIGSDQADAASAVGP